MACSVCSVNETPKGQVRLDTAAVCACQTRFYKPIRYCISRRYNNNNKYVVCTATTTTTMVRRAACKLPIYLRHRVSVCVRVFVCVCVGVCVCVRQVVCFGLSSVVFIG